MKERPFWLQLENVWQDSMPMTADKYGRVVEAARQVNPELALDLAKQVAPRRDVDWVIGFGKAQPDFVMPIAPALVRHAAERGGANHADILSRAGFIGAPPSATCTCSAARASATTWRCSIRRT